MQPRARQRRNGELRLARPALLFVALTALGVLGNALGVQLFLSVDIVFGSVAVLVVVRLFGPALGALAAVVASSYTVLRWGHPYSVVTFTLEALLVGIAAKRTGREIVLCDGLFWLLVGAPLVWLFYGGVMRMDGESTLLIVLKQSFNGLLNALLASLLLTHTPLRRWAGLPVRGADPLRRILFELMVALVLFPSLVLTVLGSNRELQKTTEDIRERLEAGSANLSALVTQWQAQHLHAIEELARRAAEPGGADRLQELASLVHGAFPEFHNVYVADAEGTTVAFHPPVNDAGEPTIGLNFADRPYFAAARESRAPVVSDVFEGRGGVRAPIVTLVAPVVRGGRFEGFALGALDLGQLEGFLERSVGSWGFQATLADRSGRVVASSFLEPLEPLENLQTGELRALDRGIYHRSPSDPTLPFMKRWRASFYGMRTPVEGTSWTLVMEAPVAPQQAYLYRRYIERFALMLGLSVLAILAATLLARRLTASLAGLAKATTNLPGKLVRQERIAWPRSGISEVDSLVGNFRLMTRTLRRRFRDVDAALEALEHRSRDLARTNAALEAEVGERKRAEEALRFLVEASSVLASSLEEDRTAEHVARLATVALASGCVVGLLERDGTLRRVAAAHRDPAEEARLRAASARPASTPRIEREYATSLEVFPVESGRDPEGVASWLREAGVRSALVLPLRTRGKALGEIALVPGADGRVPSGAELALAEELARRAAVALDNARLYGELLAADRAKEEFLAMLAHELRNPLAPIVTAVHLVRARGSGGGAAERPLAVIERQVRHMARLVDDLLDVSRITRGKVELRRQRVPLSLLVDQAVETTRPLFEERRHELSISLPEEPIELDVDPVRIGQVLSNLLHNAAKYTDPGGDVRLSAERRGLDIALRVQDNGVGIAVEVLPRVFDLFAQADRSLDRSQGGLGIGLTLVRRLVEMHGGSVRAESAGLGRGSTFTVLLPAVPRPVDVKDAGEPVAGSAPTLPSGARRVLVVDDNADGAETLAQYLETLGHVVDVASDGPRAVEQAIAGRPELVLLDIGLPGMSGYEVARRLRSERALGATVLVALTGYGQASDRQRAVEAGFDAYLTKPVDLAELEKLLAAGAPGS